MSVEKSQGQANNTLKRVAFLALTALLISLYLIHHHVAVRGGYQTSPSMCNFGGAFDCDSVANSQFSELFGIPVAALGAWYYSVVLLLCLSASFPRPVSRSSQLAALFLLSLPAVVASIFLFLISVFVINKVCLFCSLLYVISILLTLLLWFQTRGVTFRLALGLKTLFESFFQFSASAGRLLSVWAGILTSAVFFLFLPSWWEAQVLLPQRQAFEDVSRLELFLERWRAAPVQNIPVDFSNSSGGDLQIGTGAEPVSIVEFSDFQCPYCQRAAAHIKKILEKFKGQVNFVFKHFPLDQSCNSQMDRPNHLYACVAAAMVHCAVRQGQEQGWRMHDALFELKQFDWDDETLDALPGELGLDGVAFSACLESPETIASVKADIDVAGSLALRGTPSFFINGRRIEFERLEQLQGLVQAIISETKKR